MFKSLAKVVAIALGVFAVGSLDSAGIFDHPSPPTELVSSATPTGIRLQWTASPGGIIAGYNVYRSVVSTVADPTVLVNDEPIEGTEFADDTLHAGAFHCYTVRAVSMNGTESPDSNETCVSFNANAFGFFKRGDADGNGTLNISDAIATLNHLFRGTFDPLCLDAMDFNDSGHISLDDAVASLSHQFLGTTPAPLPGSVFCGFDPTPDRDAELGCTFHICEAEGT